MDRSVILARLLNPQFVRRRKRLFAQISAPYGPADPPAGVTK
jgi:hypothetical protein